MYNAKNGHKQVHVHEQKKKIFEGNQQDVGMVEANK